MQDMNTHIQCNNRKKHLVAEKSPQNKVKRMKSTEIGYQNSTEKTEKHTRAKRETDLFIQPRLAREWRTRVE